MRGYGPPESRPLATPIEPAKAVECATRFALASRIVFRIPGQDLASELGSDHARALAFKHLATIAAERRLGELMSTLAIVASERSIPLVFLKHAALRATGVIAEGSRSAGDIDVLVPTGRAREFHRRLIEYGFSAAGFPEQPHHLGLLVSPQGNPVEVHLSLPGVRLGPGQRFATAEGLLNHQHLLVRLTELPGSAWVPRRDLLLAHAIAHGFAQHGADPGHYPMSRMFADVIDLGGGADAESTARTALTWLKEDVSHAELLAVCQLARALQAGNAGGLHGETSAEATLLRHWIAGVTRPEYRDALKLASLDPKLTDRGKLTALLREAYFALFVTRGQLERIYQGPRSELGWLALRLLRPADLAARVVKAAAQHWALVRERHRTRPPSSGPA
jgi:hypothetical protein